MRRSFSGALADAVADAAEAFRRAGGACCPDRRPEQRLPASASAARWISLVGKQPVRLLEEQSGLVVVEQLQLGAQVGFSLVGDLPRGVAAVMLEEYLRTRIWGAPRREDAPATQKQREFWGPLRTIDRSSACPSARASRLRGSITIWLSATPINFGSSGWRRETE